VITKALSRSLSLSLSLSRVRARTHARTRGCFNRASVYLETAKTRAKLLFDGNDPIHGAFSSRASYKTRGERYVLAKYAADLTSSSDVVGPPCARVWYVEKEGDRERERERESFPDAIHSLLPPLSSSPFSFPFPFFIILLMAQGGVELGRTISCVCSDLNRRNVISCFLRQGCGDP